MKQSFSKIAGVCPLSFYFRVRKSSTLKLVCIKKMNSSILILTLAITVFAVANCNPAGTICSE